MAITITNDNSTETETVEDSDTKIDPFDFMSLAAADNQRGRVPLYFDFETIPDPDRCDLLDDGVNRKPCEFPKAEDVVSGTVDAVKDAVWKLPYTDATISYLELLALTEQQGKSRAGVISVISSMQKTIESSGEQRRKTLSVTPELCKIAAVGWAIGDGPTHSVLTLDEATEFAAIESFWKLVKAFGPVVGFNVLGFDLPVLFVRSHVLGIKPLKKLDMRPWGNDVVDLMKARYPVGKATGLKLLAKYYGFEVPAGDVDGSQVAALVESDPEKVREYVESDVQITRQLHRTYAGTFC